jgi:uncharacterized protein (DUF1684 family)
MRTYDVVAVALLSLVLTGCRKPVERSASHGLPADYTATVEQWRAKHEADYRRDWSTIAGLFPLRAGRNTAGSGPKNDVTLPESLPPSVGTFVLEGEEVRFEPSADAGVRVKDQPLTQPMMLKDDSTPAPDELRVGDVRLVIHRSGGTRSLRVRDPNGPLAKGFLGFQWFPVDPLYRVVGRFLRDPEPSPMQVMNTYGDIDTYQSEGVIEFTLNGQPLRLRPFTTRPGRFYIVFRDQSSGGETYEAARFLYADLLDDGTTVLDFNQAYNPPCAFNPYTTCPIPIPANRLPVKVLAGEKAYPVHVPLPRKAATPELLVPQRDQRIDAGRAPRRKEGSGGRHPDK